MNLLTKKTKKVLYINYFCNEIANKLFAIKIDLYMKKYIERFADICNILDVDGVNLNNYDLLLLNIMAFVPQINGLEKKIIETKANKIKNHKKVAILLHDLHDYSLKYSQSMFKLNTIIENGKKKYVPNLSNNIAKREYVKFFEQLNIKYLISIYDCPEYDFFYKNFKNIKKFFIISHGFCPYIFKPLEVNKKYDILFYGCEKREVYPFRVRIYEICKRMNLKIKKLDYVMGDANSKKKQSEEVLCKYINQSWLCIACVSNFSYFVRKYLEISACNSLVLGDTNKQGEKIIGNNMVKISSEMSDNEIMDKIKYHLDNKKIIYEKTINNHKKLKNYTYKKVVGRIKKISSSIINNTECKYDYIYFKKSLE